MAEFRLGPVCDVGFRGGDVPPKCPIVFLASTMVSNVFDAGQGIGIIEAMLMLPIVAMFWPGPLPGLFDDGFGIGSVISVLTAPIPFSV